jgi:multidrug efflux pump subunit AcrA (membrane-fusion protein)
MMTAAGSDCCSIDELELPCHEQVPVSLRSFISASFRQLPAAVRPHPLTAAALAVLVAACGEAPRQQVVLPPAKVTVARPVQRTIVDHDEYVGRFVAVESVEIRARVWGYLAKVHFQDGQYLKQGDLLFTIDRRPFQNTVDQAAANLETAKSNLAFAEADLARGHGHDDAACHHRSHSGGIHVR